MKEMNKIMTECKNINCKHCSKSQICMLKMIKLDEVGSCENKIIKGSMDENN